MTKEYVLFKEYQKTRDKKIRDELVHRYTYIAKILAQKFNGSGIEYDDIYQVACMGVVYAVERFNPDRGVQFATFATPTVLGEIRRFFRDKGNFIKIPRRLYEIFCKAENLRRKKENMTVDEVAKHLNMPREVVEEAYRVGDAAFIKSLEDEAYTDGGLSLSNMVGRDDEGFMLIENSDFLKYCMSKLDEKEAEFVRLRFYNEKTQREISDKWNVSQMYVSRLERRVIEKLKNLYLND
ncbi:MAG: sigma-70 family RNA polymerase sigma factor [Firmicutes bacterium]|nr:sigma-70 family RNA polymerase sigma factor [Bacillota bacterium]